MRLIISIIFCYAILLVSCDDSPTFDYCNVSCDDLPKIVSNNEGALKGDASLQIDTAVISNRLLSLPVRYVGGCQTHCFNLAYQFFPVSVHNGIPVFEFKVNHFGNCDNCESFILDTLQFDLEPLVEDLKSKGALDSTNKVNIIFQNHHTIITYRL